MLACVSVVGMMMLGADANLLSNGGFDNGTNGWQPNSAEVAMGAAGGVAFVTVPNDARPGYPGLYQELPVEPGQVLELRCAVRAVGVQGGHGAYVAVEFHKGAAGRLTYSQSDGLVGDSQWTERVVRCVTPPEADRARVVLLLNGNGTARFDNVRLATAGSVAAEPLDGPVTLTVTDDVACDSLVGFGFEDDGWLYNPNNAEKGVTPEDYAVREERVKWMDPDHVRMFFWIADYCPSGDWENYTFDSPNMLSKYRTLDTYQAIGTDVNVTGTEWGLKGVYDDPDKAARGIATLLEHLVKERDYTCIKYWTLTNEPNGRGHNSWTDLADPFEGYAAVHYRLKEELARRGLDIRIVGSDDTSGFEWFERCVETPEYHAIADIYASHRYSGYADRFLAPFFFRERLDLLTANAPRKPLVIEEFGFQDGRSGTLENPIMMTYPYAVWTAAFCIEGLNLGVAGFAIWALHEVYYPNNAFMEYALWEFKDDGWKVRPVYHAMANFTRLTERGDKVFRCDSSSPAHVLGARVGDTLFWVNRSDEAAEVVVAGFTPKEVRIHTEQNLQGDRECGDVQPLADGRFTAPPQSFGYAK